MLPSFLFGQAEGKDKFQISKVDNGWIVNYVDVVMPEKAEDEDEDEEEEDDKPWEEKGAFDGIAKLIKAAGAIKNAAGTSTPKTLVFLDKVELMKFLAEKL